MQTASTANGTASIARTRKSDRTAIESYWLATIVYNAPSPASAILNADTLPHMLEIAVRDATYYLGIGYKHVTVEIEQRCSECNGTGEQRLARSRTHYVTRTCKACKGQPILSSITAFPVKIHENVAIIDPNNISGE